MNLIKCASDDFDKISNFYKYVINNTPTMKQYARWIYGQHPTDDMIRQYINDGYMYYSEVDSVIYAAVALTPFQGSDYHSVEWELDLQDDEVCVVHIFCVNPDLQRKGIAKEIMKEVMAFAKESGKRAVRLDALCCNEPAHKLYEKLGFKKCGVQRWYADNTGWIDFYLYEKCL